MNEITYPQASTVVQKSTYVTDGVVHQVRLFEQTSVVWTEDGKSFKVQCIDTYGYQREFSLTYRRDPGTPMQSWVLSAYKHPFRPHREEVISAGVAGRLRERLLELVEQHPSLLFNCTGEHTSRTARPRAEGFCRWHEALLWEMAEASVKSLDRLV